MESCFLVVNNSAGFVFEGETPKKAEVSELSRQVRGDEDLFRFDEGENARINRSAVRRPTGRVHQRRFEPAGAPLLQDFGRAVQKVLFFRLFTV